MDQHIELQERIVAIEPSHKNTVMDSIFTLRGKTQHYSMVYDTTIHTSTNILF